MTEHFQTIAAMACMKSSLMVFNFIFWLSGIIILIVGIWMEVDLYKYTEMSTKYSNVIPYVLIGIGTCIFLIGSFACCCTLKGQPNLLYIYGCILSLIFIFELSLSISIYAYRTKLMEGFDDGLTEAMNNYHNETAIAKDFDSMQQTLHCCGNHNSSDWLNIKPPKIPQSCCIKENCDSEDEAQIFPEVANFYYEPQHNHHIWKLKMPKIEEKQRQSIKKCYVQMKSAFSDGDPDNFESIIYHKLSNIFILEYFKLCKKGCYEKIVNFLNSNIKGIAVVAMVAAIFPLMGLVLSCSLARLLNKHKYEQMT